MNKDRIDSYPVRSLFICSLLLVLLFYLLLVLLFSLLIYRHRGSFTHRFHRRGPGSGAAVPAGGERGFIAREEIGIFRSHVCQYRCEQGIIPQVIKDHLIIGIPVGMPCIVEIRPAQ